MESGVVIITLGGVITAMSAYIVRLHIKLDTARKEHIKFAERAKNLAANGGGGQRRDSNERET